jgi:DNA polymerase III subunit gamma/tau
MGDASEANAQTHLALYRRFRAQTFSQMVGQAAVVETLRNAVRLGRLGHGFLFVGPRGTGKTSMARILAKAVNCTDLRDGEPCDACPSCVAIREGRALDVIELDAASNNRVDDMRELLPRVYTASSDLRRKVFIIDEVQRIKEGWDVLLKTLEEPPDGVLFVFCTTDPSQIRPAVVSRLQRFTFRPLPATEIGSKLARILEVEGRSAEPDALALIARLAAGGMRDAESMLDQVLGSVEDPVTVGAVRDLLGLAEESLVRRFVAALVAGDAMAGIGVLDELEAEGRDVVAFSEQVVGRLREDLVAELVATDGRLSEATALAHAARRLTGIDASRSGLGGYRWQLELCLLAAAADAPVADRGPDASEARPSPTAPCRATPPAEPTRADEPALPPAPAPAPRADESDAGGSTSGVSSPGDVAAAPGQAAETSGPDPRPDSTARAPSSAPSSSPSSSPERSPSPLDAPGSNDLLARLRDGWSEVVAHVGRNPANRPIVTACRPVEVRDGIVVLGFPESQAFLRDIAERKRAALEDGVAAVLGRSLGVRCVVTDLELVGSTSSDGDDLVAHARRIFEDELVDVDEIA